MSASLVGSEMCIRDRDHRRRLELHPDRPRAGLRQAGPGRRGGEAERGPVSYTHLTLPTICSV
eukprot:11455648-Alexandrium_andersonii.AAC.1